MNNIKKSKFQKKSYEIESSGSDMLSPQMKNIFPNIKEKKHIQLIVIFFAFFIFSIFVLVVYGRNFVQGSNTDFLENPPFQKTQEQKEDRIKQILKEMGKIPRYKEKSIEKEVNEEKQKEYFAFRLKNWKNNTKLFQAEQDYNHQKYNLEKVHKELSICIPVLSNEFALLATKKIIETVLRQKYSNYQIVVYRPNLSPVDLQQNKKVKIINEKMSDLKECDGYDIVLMVREGQMIGRYVLQRINSIYQDKFIKMTYSDVLGFDSLNKSPVSRSQKMESEQKLEFWVKSYFSRFSWSFRGKSLARISKRLKEIENICGNEASQIFGESFMGFNEFSQEEIHHIEEFDLYIENSETERSAQKCAQKLLQRKVNVADFEALKAMQTLPKSAEGTEQEKQINETLESMRMVPVHLQGKNKKISDEKEIYFAYRLSHEPDNSKYRAAEYQYFDRKYKIGSYETELPFCLVTVGTINKTELIDRYLNSIARQNYSNYHAVYVDHLSEDGSVDQIGQLIFNEYPEIKDKITIVSEQNINILGSFQNAVTNHCKKGQIILDVDIRKQLIGSQILKLYNAIYNGNHDTWAVYSNSIAVDSKMKSIQKGNHAFKPESLKTLQLQPFTGLRSFRKELYMKIDKSDLQDKDGHFYEQIGDELVNIFLSELSSFDRIIFLEEYNTKYWQAVDSEKEKEKVKVSEILIGKTPFEILSSLSSKAEKRMQKYEITQNSESSQVKQAVEERKNEYHPVERFQRGEKGLKRIIEQNNKTYICSGEKVMEMAILAQEFTTKRNPYLEQLEEYYFETRNQTLFHKKKQYPIFIIVQAEEPEKYFESFYHALVRQNYENHSLVVLYKDREEKSKMKNVMMKEDPIFLEKTFFLLKESYPSIQLVIADLWKEPSIVIQLSMKSQLAGSQTLLLVNSFFRKNKNVEAMVPFSMTHINNKKIQVYEVGKNMIGSSEQYFDYHHRRRELLAMKVEGRKQISLDEQKIKVVPNVLTLSHYEFKKREKMDFNMKKMQLAMKMFKKTAKIPKKLHPGSFFKPKPFTESYLASLLWKQPQQSLYKDLTTYLYKKNYGFGNYASELPLCIVAVGQSPQLQDTYEGFLESVYRQKYQNYAVVLGHINSDDSTDLKIREQIERKGMNFSKKFRTLKSYPGTLKENIFSVKANLSKNHCKEDELVVQFDATDELIGVNVFGLINTVFQANPELWFVVANSLYEDLQQKKETLILPSSPKDLKYVWEIFHYDKMKIMRKPFLENVASQLPSLQNDNQAYLRLLQQSGSRFSFLNQFLSFDHQTDVYTTLTSEQKYKLCRMISSSYLPLKYQTDQTEQKIEGSFQKKGLVYQNFRSLFYYKKLYQRKEVEERVKEIQEEKYNNLMDEVMKPLNSEEDKRKSTYMFYRLKDQPDNEKYLKAEYMYLNRKYDIQKYPEQLPICVISAGRNLKEKNDSYKLYIDSMARMNYTNFRLVYTDDISDDGTAQAMRSYVDEKYPFLSSKLKIIETEERIYSLGNKNNMVRYHCDNENDIIYDIDADDFLLGRQFFKVLNAVYQSGDFWFVYANYCWVNQKQAILQGASMRLPKELIAEHSYRRKTFVTIGPRSFLRKLYMKIDEKQFKNEAGRYYIEIGDGFIYMALSELAGVDHSYFIHESPYFYNTYNYMGNLQIKRENAEIMKSKTPFKTLSNMSDKVEKVQNFTLTPQFREDIENGLKWYKKLIQKRDQIADKQQNKMIVEEQDRREKKTENRKQIQEKEQKVQSEKKDSQSKLSKEDFKKSGKIQQQQIVDKKKQNKKPQQINKKKDKNPQESNPLLLKQKLGEV